MHPCTKRTTGDRFPRRAQELYPSRGRVPYTLVFSAFRSLDESFDGLTDGAAALGRWTSDVHAGGYNCTVRNVDDETGGFLVTQGGISPPGRVARSVDENGAFDVLQVVLTPRKHHTASQPARTARATYGLSAFTTTRNGQMLQVFLEQRPSGAIWLPVRVAAGLVNVSGPTLRACPAGAINASAGVAPGTRCLRFRRDDYAVRAAARGGGRVAVMSAVV